MLDTYIFAGDLRIKVRIWKCAKPRSIKNFKQTSWEDGKAMLSAIEACTGKFSKLVLVNRE